MIPCHAQKPRFIALGVCEAIRQDPLIFTFFAGDMGELLILEISRDSPTLQSGQYPAYVITHVVDSGMRFMQHTPRGPGQGRGQRRGFGSRHDGKGTESMRPKGGISRCRTGLSPISPERRALGSALLYYASGQGCSRKSGRGFVLQSQPYARSSRRRSHPPEVVSGLPSWNGARGSSSAIQDTGRHQVGIQRESPRTLPPSAASHP